VPRNISQKTGIRIKVGNPQYRVIYDNQVRTDHIERFLQKRKRPYIQLTGLDFSGAVLSMRIQDCYLPRVEGKMRGRIQVRILVKDRQNRQVFQDMKMITARKKQINITVSFDWLKRGRYFFIAEVKDLFTGKSSMNFLEVHTAEN
jgi:hypothetical protein